MNLFGIDLSPEVIGAFIAGQVSLFLQSQIVSRVKRWFIRSIIFNDKNADIVANVIDDELDKIEARDPVIGSATRAGVVRFAKRIEFRALEKDKVAKIKGKLVA